MRAMVLEAVGAPLVARDVDEPACGTNGLVLDIGACGVCRTDLHVVDGELPGVRPPLIPGHEIIGRVRRMGANVSGFALGQRVGATWLAGACGRCFFCQHQQENLCDASDFTGYTRPGGYAGAIAIDANYALALPDEGDDVADAPLMCAGLIGWRSLKRAGEGGRVGLYGFGAAAHIVTQLLGFQGRETYAFTRAGDLSAQAFARSLGACWTGGADEPPPVLLDAAIIYAPAGELVPAALAAVRKGGRVVCAGIHMSDIPSFPYALLWGERELVSVANLTRQDGAEFLALARRAGVRTQTKAYPLSHANEALADLRAGRLVGAAVLVPEV